MILKADNIFFKIFEEHAQVYDNRQDAYEAAEEYFAGLTQKGFGQQYRKYSSYEVFHRAYTRKTKDKTNGSTDI